jgi:prepilin-type N-terminal cleavage/methylation domain-containing protein
MHASSYVMHARRRGVTLPELAITMALVGLLTAVAMPSVRRSMRRYSLEEGTQKFSAALVEAQTTAIKLNRAVTVERMGTTGYRVDGGTTRLLPTSVTFTSASAPNVRFVSFGPPSTGAVSFTLQWDAANQRTVSVNAGGRIIR